jgi:dephospho-CoA kinase
LIILGLTGSIGMGKTTTSDNFRKIGIPIHDADQAVHEMMSEGGEALAFISETFPASVRNGSIDRKVIAKEVFSDKKVLNKIEKFLHPLVRLREKAFLGRCARQGKKIVVLDIPLLFETGGEKRCDGVITVSAPKYIQFQRVMCRPDMTPERFKTILSRQVSDTEKRKRSDFVILTGLGRHFSLIQTKMIVKITKKWKGRNWPTSIKTMNLV